jgi:tetratricopeptide (TPR) repeat protein
MPSYARAAYNAGLALAQVGRHAEAERLLRRAVELEPSNYDLVFALGDFLLRQGRLSEVGPIADRMTALDPTRPEAAQLRSRLGTIERVGDA